MRRPPAHVVAIIYFVSATTFLVWPLFPWLGNRATPFVFGLPFALVYVLSVIVLNFVVLVLCHRFEVVRADEAGPP